MDSLLVFFLRCHAKEEREKFFFKEKKLKEKQESMIRAMNND